MTLAWCHTREGWKAPVLAAAPAPSHTLCVQGEAQEVLGCCPQETWSPRAQKSTPMPSCLDEDDTCVVPHDGRNRRPPSLLAEALSSACPIPIPRVSSTRRGVQGHPPSSASSSPHFAARLRSYFTPDLRVHRKTSRRREVFSGHLAITGYETSTSYVLLAYLIPTLIGPCCALSYALCSVCRLCISSCLRGNKNRV